MSIHRAGSAANARVDTAIKSIEAALFIQVTFVFARLVRV
jgi:hypothetical protein